MPGRDFLCALLIVAGAVSIGQGLNAIPLAAALNSLIGAGLPSGRGLTVGLVALPILYGSALIILSRPISRVLMPQRTGESPTGIQGFAESLIGVSGVLILGLALVDMSTIYLKLNVMEAGSEMLNESRGEHGWRHWLQPTGRLVLGVILLASRGSIGSFLRSRRPEVAG